MYSHGNRVFYTILFNPHFVFCNFRNSRVVYVVREHQWSLDSSRETPFEEYQNYRVILS